MKSKKMFFLFSFFLFVSLMWGCVEKVSAQGEFTNAWNMFNDYYNLQGVSYDNAFRQFGQDNASTACFIASQSKVGLQDIYRVYSTSGNDWNRVLTHYNINPTTLFLPVSSTYKVGPPYGNAYGYWKKHQNNPSSPIVLSSNDVVNLVNMKVINKQLGISAINIMKYRASNQSFPMIVNNEYKRIDKGNNKTNPHRGDDNGKGYGKDHGNGHDNGQGQGNDKHK